MSLSKSITRPGIDADGYTDFSGLEHAEQEQYDRWLATRAALKILRAQDGGTVSLNVSVHRTYSQVIVESQIQQQSPRRHFAEGADLSWLMKNFPPTRTKTEPWAYGTIKGRGRRGVYLQVVKHEHDLRPTVNPDNLRRWVGIVPRVEYTTVVPHVCDRWVAEFATGKRPVFTCRGCQKRMSVTDARAAGLMSAKS
jgi:hypothetical protein